MPKLKLRTKVSGLVSPSDLEDRELILGGNEQTIYVKDNEGNLIKFIRADDNSISADNGWSSYKINTEINKIDTRSGALLKMVNLIWGGGDGIINGYYTNDFLVSPTSPVSMNIKVNPGIAFINRDLIESSDIVTLSISVCTTGARIDLIELDQSDSSIVVSQGIVNSGSPPNLDENCIPLANIYVQSGQISITSSNIEDVRVFL